MPYYRPRSEASEGYAFTGVCHSVTEQGGGGGQHQRSTTYPSLSARVRGQPPIPRGQRSTTYPLDRSEVNHLPPYRHYAQAGGTYPTGMHFCWPKIYVQRITR